MTMVKHVVTIIPGQFFEWTMTIPETFAVGVIVSGKEVKPGEAIIVRVECPTLTCKQLKEPHHG